jgi:PHD/YefM family antitoxin component YafN of YafNO toxin-antitoxin module
MYMTTYTATEAKNNFGAMLIQAQRAPVAIQKSGQNVAFMFAPESVEQMEDFYLATKAHYILNQPDAFMSEEASDVFLKKMLHAA